MDARMQECLANVGRKQAITEQRKRLERVEKVSAAAAAGRAKRSI
jgi:hypothetical protein